MWYSSMAHPGSLQPFVPLAKALSAHTSCRILLYNLPGYDQSQSYQRQPGAVSDALFDGDTSVQFQREALSELMHHLRIDGKNGHEAPSIIAHDIAGAIVLRAHLLHGCQKPTQYSLGAMNSTRWSDLDLGFSWRYQYTHSRRTILTSDYGCSAREGVE